MAAHFTTMASDENLEKPTRDAARIIAKIEKDADLLRVVKCQRTHEVMDTLPPFSRGELWSTLQKMEKGTYKRSRRHSRANVVV